MSTSAFQNMVGKPSAFYENSQVNNVRKLRSEFACNMDATKPRESQTPLLEREASKIESSNCSHRLNGKEITINAMDITAVNLVLNKNGTVVFGNHSQLNICKRCFLRERVSQSKSTESGVLTDGKGVSNQIKSTTRTKPTRRKRKRSSKVQATSKCERDGNYSDYSADGENSDSDNADKFPDFLQSDSDD